MELQTTNFEISQPSQAIQVAEILQRFVKEKKLTVNIKGKEYPLVEAWSFAGSQLGLYPYLTNIENVSTETEVKYLAEVEIRRYSDHMVVAKGIAICSNKEANKKFWDEYAILSMAQTRATGKAFRNLLSWIMKAAGFEATPAEEMDFNSKVEPVNEGPTEEEKKILRNLVGGSDLNESERELAYKSIEVCADYTQYQKLQYRLEERQLPFDQIPNPSQKDIKNHLKKTVK